MFRRLYRCGKRSVGAVVALAALIAVAEVGLRIHTLTMPAPVKSRGAPTPLAVPSWTTGWELRPLGRATIRPDDGEPFVFRTNRWGFRGGDVAVPKPAGIFRLVCLGDACLVGARCPEPQTFCVQLQTGLQAGTSDPIEVVNAGLPMGGASLALIHAEHIISSLQPDVVLLTIDAQDVLQDIVLRKWMTRDREGQPVSCSPPENPVGAKPNFIARLRDEFRLIDCGWQRLSHEWSRDRSEAVTKSRPAGDLPREQLERALSPLQELQRQCESRHVRLLLVASPARGVLLTNDDQTPPGNLTDSAFFAALGEFVKQSGVTGIDATAVFADSVQRDHSDWTIDEHRALAALVAQGIRERLPGPWSSPYLQPNGVTPASHRVPVPPARR